MAAKKAYLVMSRNTNVLDAGLKTDKGHLKFKKGKTSMMVSDPALANEIDKVHGLKGSGDVWVHEDPQAEPFLRDDGRIGMGIHKYFWGASPRYSIAWEEFEKRRKAKNEKNVEQPKATKATESKRIETKQKGVTRRTKKYRNGLTVRTASADEVLNDNAI
jgi:hypothetical protein